jgi:hypothetical protein
VSARIAASPEAPPSPKSPFIVDAPAPMLKRHDQLSKNARHLYMTLRALADGRTGELKVNGRWLRAKVFDAAAEICRNVRLAAMNELIAAGLVTLEFERVLRFIGGRRRAVRSRCRYTVYRTAQKPNVLRGSDAQTVAKPRHRTAQKPNVSGGSDPKIVEKPRILLKSFSCTVQEKDSQVLSRLPSAAPIPTAGFELVGETVGEGSKSSLTRARKARDVQRTNPPLPCYENFKDQFPGVTSRQFAFAVERISSRAKTPPRTLQFWPASLRNFFEEIEGETDLFLTDRVIALFHSGASLGDVAESLKGEAASRDLAYGADLIDRVIRQALGRIQRDAAVRSELQRG